MRKNLSVKTYFSNSEKETERIARAFAGRIGKGEIIALYGELGAGKTVFVRAVARSLGIREKVTSPTFIILKSYPLPGKKTKFNHLDLYRFDSPEDFQSLDFTEIINNPRDITFIEWAEKAETILPLNRINVRIAYAGDNRREIAIEAPEK